MREASGGVRFQETIDRVTSGASVGNTNDQGGVEMKKRESNRPVKGESGFTLIEVLLVVAILGILATVVVVNFSGKGKAARREATRASIAAICTAIDMYEVDMGQFPRSLDSLMRNPGVGDNWNGPYLRGGKVPQDAWGQEFGYTQDGKTYRVTSRGPPGEGEPLTSFDF